MGSARSMHSIRTLIGTTLAALIFAATPSDAAPVPSFNESPGCGALNGYRGPQVARSGRLADSTPIYGPWGDFYGRTIGQVRDQLVPVSLSGTAGQYRTIYVHQRVLPALELVLDNLAREAEEDPDRVYALTSAVFSFSPATIPPHRRMSFHAVGAAVDVNSRDNPYRSDNELITDMADWYVEAWRSAGWCWGGDWLRIKDTMHFSWMGPLHTPGYEMLPPQPPLVGPAAYDDHYDLGVDFGLPAGVDASHHVVDMDRDGAVDVVRIKQRSPEGLSLIVARAWHGHDQPRLFSFAAEPLLNPDGPRLLADVTGDARPDLVVLVRGGTGTIVLQVFELALGYRMPQSTIVTESPFDTSAVALLDDVDLDGATDLLMIRPGDPASLTVWSGPDFRESHGPYPLEVALDGHWFATGDRNLDGYRDLFAIDRSGRLTVHYGPDFTITSQIETSVRIGDDDEFFVADLDGDGHPDLLVTDPDGSTMMYRGGQSTHEPGVWYETTAADRAQWRCGEATEDRHGLPTQHDSRCLHPG